MSSAVEVVLGEEDRQTLLLGASRCAHDPYQDFEAFLKHAETSFRALSEPVRLEFQRFVAGDTRAGALAIRGLPEDGSLPPTPTRDDGGRFTTSTISEYTMCAVASGAGEPTGYAPERWGNLVHNVFPTAGEGIPSQRFKTVLGFHSELSCHSESPEHVLLLCLRQDPACEAITWVLEVRTLVENLPDNVTEDLFRPEFSLDLGRLHYIYLSNGVRISESPHHRPVTSVLTGVRSDPFIRFEPDLMTPLTQRAADAFAALAEVVPKLATPIILTPGSALLIDNRRSLHARSPFTATFDGKDRWLRRMMILSSARPRPQDGRERVFDTDLLAGWAHLPTVASIGAFA